jgi:hypothetical protein
MPRCLEWGEERHKECSEYRDQGHNECADWDSRCCTWWPCSWACKLVTWICVGWYWVSSIVCVAWTWITTAVCLVWDVVTTIVNAVLVTLESILGWVLSALAFVVELIFSIPFVGRLLKWIWNVVIEIVWNLVGIGDFVLGLIGIRPEKKLRICVIVLRDEKGVEVASPASVVPHIQNAIDIFRAEANVRVIPVGPFQYDSGFADDERASTEWVHVVDGPSDSEILDVECGVDAAGEDLTTVGSRFELLMSTMCFYGNWRRVVGYGAPVTVFVTRTVGDTFRLGCSLGPLSDYVTIEGGNPICVPHELGHACNLWHVGGATNLMNESCGRRELDWWQISILRNSRHVTYF